MPKPKFNPNQPFTKPAFDPNQAFIPVPAGSESAPRQVNEMHPDITTKERFVAQGLGNSPESKAAYLKQEHPDLDVTVFKGDVLVKKPSESEYRRLDPSGFSFSDLPYDLLDVVPDVAAGAITGGGLALAGPVGAGLGGAVGEAGRQWAGKLSGIPQEISGMDVALSGGANALLPLLGKAVAAPAYEGVKKVANAVVPRLSSILTSVPKEAIEHLISSPRGVLDALKPAAGDAPSNIYKLAQKVTDAFGQRAEDANTAVQAGKNAARQRFATTGETLSTEPALKGQSSFLEKFKPTEEGASALSPDEIQSLGEIGQKYLTKNGVPERSAMDVQKFIDMLDNQLVKYDNKKASLTPKDTQYESYLKSLRGQLKEQLHDINPELRASDQAYTDFLSNKKTIEPFMNPETAQREVNLLFGPNKEYQRSVVKQELPEDVWNQISDLGAAKAFTKQGPSGSSIGQRHNLGAITTGLGLLGLERGHGVVPAILGAGVAAATNPQVHKQVIGRSVLATQLAEDLAKKVPPEMVSPLLSNILLKMGEVGNSERK